MEVIERLLMAISKAGLREVAKGYALETVERIVSTKSDVVNRWPVDEVEMKRRFDDDTIETARVLSKPVNWGISDERWKEFCKEWKC